MNSRKLKIFSFLSVVAIVFSLVVVSYTEEVQVKLLMPIRDYFKTPNIKIEKLPENNIGSLIKFKSSDDGYYINPWMTASSVSREANLVIKNGCDSLNPYEISSISFVADYFLSTAKTRYFNSSEFLVWEYPIKYTYGLKPGWISAPAQAEIATVLAAASRCNADSKYAEATRKVIESFLVQIENGGIRANLGGSVWFEEYAQPGIEPPLVFNGHVFAVLAMENLVDFHPMARIIYKEGLNSIQENIHVYDNGYWSWYDTKGEPANNIYQQKLHVMLLAIIYNKTGDPIISNYYNKFYWQSFNPFSSLIRFIIRPSRFLFVLIVLNFIFFLIFNYLLYLVFIRYVFENFNEK